MRSCRISYLGKGWLTRRYGNISVTLWGSFIFFFFFSRHIVKCVQTSPSHTRCTLHPVCERVWSPRKIYVKPLRCLTTSHLKGTYFFANERTHTKRTHPHTHTHNEERSRHTVQPCTEHETKKKNKPRHLQHHDEATVEEQIVLLNAMWQSECKDTNCSAAAAASSSSSGQTLILVCSWRCCLGL